MEKTLIIISLYIGTALLALRYLLLGLVIFLTYKKKLRQYAAAILAGVAAFEILAASILTILQYKIWSMAPETLGLLSVPLENPGALFWIHTPIQAFVSGAHGYYILYAYTNFWLPLLTVLVITFFVAVTAGMLRYFRPLFLQKSDILLATALTLLFARLVQASGLL